MAEISLINWLSLEKFAGIHKGRSGVIVGTGPTLRQYIYNNSSIHFGVNEAVFCDGVSLDYLFVQDTKPAHENGYSTNPKPYDEYPCFKFAGITPECPEVSNIHPAAIIEHGWCPYEVGAEAACDWVKQCDQFRLGDGQSVSFSAAQFALFTGINRLYLVGMDILTDKTIRDKNPHGVNPYRQFHHIDRWRNFGAWAKSNYDVEIISINPVGLKGIFEEEYT